jgi:hypothetical protein
MVTDSETTTGVLCDSELVTSDHLDLDTESLRIVDGLLGIVMGRIEDAEETDRLEPLPSASKSSPSTSS